MIELSCLIIKDFLTLVEVLGTVPTVIFPEATITSLLHSTSTISVPTL